MLEHAKAIVAEFEEEMEHKMYPQVTDIVDHKSEEFMLYLSAKKYIEKHLIRQYLQNQQP